MAFGVKSRFQAQDEFNPNNMVIVVRWDGEVILDSAFIALPILPIEELPTKRKKIKIPYYGVEDVLVSIRYKNEARGIRPIPKQPDNFVSIDLQINQRNVHIKLSSNNALVMGVTSIEEGRAAVECLLDTIYMSDQHMSYLKKCNKNN